MNHTINKLLLFAMMLVMSACALDEDLDPLDTGDDRDKFVGTWLFSETIIRSTAYSVTISNDATNSSQVLLKNLGNLGSSYSAYGIVTSSSIEVPSQVVHGLSIKGSGTLTSENEMEWEYTISGEGDEEVCTAIATR